MKAMDRPKRSKGTEDPKVATKSRRNGASALALVSLALPFGMGCSDNRLPPNPVPDPGDRTPLPAWFDPNAKWDAKNGDTRIYIEGKIVFEVDRAVIRKESDEVLQKLLAFLKERADITRVRIEGHTDSTASNEYNQELSARRALAVSDWLVDRGIDHLRLVAVGFGETKPMYPNDTRPGRSENRRTEFHVAEVTGRPFGPVDALSGGMVLTVLSAEERERLRNPPPVERPELIAVRPTGNEIKQVKPPAPKDEEQVIQAPKVPEEGAADTAPNPKGKDKPQ